MPKAKCNPCNKPTIDMKPKPTISKDSSREMRWQRVLLKSSAFAGMPAVVVRDV